MTPEERAALLSIQCRWCEAAVGKKCVVKTKKRRDIAVTTLEGGFHDVRWQDALGRPAPVRGERVEEYTSTREPKVGVTRHTPEVGTPPERPW